VPATIDPQVARFLKALDETQFLAPERLQAYQRRLLSTLLRHARSETDFYADRLAPVFRPDDTIDWERWQEIPILTRSEAQKAGNALAARSLPVVAGAAIDNRSSGSTGEPFQYRSTHIQNVATGCANERLLNWHKLDPDALTAIIWAMDRQDLAAYPAGRSSTGWRPWHPESRVVSLAITTPVADQVEWLHRTGATYFSSYPTSMREVGRLAMEQGAPLSFAAVLTNGETNDADTRRDIREYFGHEPIDRYGATEIGLIAANCPHSTRHHIVAEMVLIEIADEEGTPAEPGVEGRIVATPFYSLAMPLIRYDTGDWGALSAESCTCGRTLPQFDRIHGRTRNMFRFSDGTRIWPVLQSWKVQPLVPHRQFQVVQTGLDQIEYRYVPVDPTQPVDVTGLTALARAQLHPSVNITPVAVTSIPRSSGGKREDYVSLIV
jgi:phenylacetate-CoA ligase